MMFGRVSKCPVPRHNSRYRQEVPVPGTVVRAAVLRQRNQSPEDPIASTATCRLVSIDDARLLVIGCATTDLA